MSKCQYPYLKHNKHLLNLRAHVSDANTRYDFEFFVLFVPTATFHSGLIISAFVSSSMFPVISYTFCRTSVWHTTTGTENNTRLTWYVKTVVCDDDDIVSYERVLCERNKHGYGRGSETVGSTDFCTLGGSRQRSYYLYFRKTFVARDIRTRVRYAVME